MTCCKFSGHMEDVMLLSQIISCNNRFRAVVSDVNTPHKNSMSDTAFSI